MCFCKDNNWCRLYQETQGGKFPPSVHAPGCNEYHQEEFVLVYYSDTACVLEVHEAQSLLEESCQPITMVRVFLTRDQFENIADFVGF
jgi:hypothetical protein